MLVPKDHPNHVATNSVIVSTHNKINMKQPVVWNGLRNLSIESAHVHLKGFGSMYLHRKIYLQIKKKNGNKLSIRTLQHNFFNV